MIKAFSDQVSMGYQKLLLFNDIELDDTSPKPMNIFLMFSQNTSHALSIFSSRVN
jgi:hypothetical protein